MNIYSAM